ncbi:MAG TPA: chromosome segregation protein SMC [Anaerolineales bacterium]|nr:chromosome segregation protein SMC [Anaerolineales bacterium]
MNQSLKSLELQGYKTFANRTLFEFAGRVTAIVGPNGSGKSNIADSLRWVLGEQSYSLLRARRTEDMIFSGSEQRARSGMASATVVFDNSDGWLPIEYSEVAVTRRAYRDGQNEYLINGQRVRLKDVSELLARSGLAERTYTIIGQGVVDAALALRADERRRLFEEAAGIGLHRSRREEALRRLETTRRNLERVKDILAELQPRLRSLERQARRTQEFEQVRSDLRALLRDWYGYHWHRAQQDLAAAQNEARREEKALERSRRAQLELDGKLATMRQDIQGLRAHLNSWHRQLAALHTQREDLIRQGAVADERRRSLNEQTHALQAEIARLGEELNLHQERLDSAAQEVARLESEMEEASVQSEAARQALQVRQAEREAAEIAVQTARQDLADIAARQGELQARRAGLHSLEERQTQEQEEALKSIEVAQKALEVAREKADAADQVQKQAKANLDTCRDALQAHQKQLVEAETARRETQQEYNMASGEKARIQTQLEVLQQAESAMAGYAGGARILLKAAQQARLEGASGSLSSHLQVPEHLETAIAAALGEYLDAVILDGSKAEETALDILAEETVRGMLLPLHSIVPLEPISLPDGRDSLGESFLGVAAELVSAPANLRRAITLLLGRTLVVNERTGARQVIKRLQSRLAGRQIPDVRVVTLKGEVFHATGLVAAGQEGRTTILSRPRQQSELRVKQKEIQTRLGTLEAGLSQQDQQIRRLTDDQILLEEEMQAARLEVDQALISYSRTNAALEQAERQVEEQTRLQKRLVDELARARDNGEQISTELADLESRLGQAREELRQSIQRLGELALDEQQSQAAHWQTLVAVARRSLEAAQTRQDERQLMLRRSQAAQASARERLDELGEALNTLESDNLVRKESESGLAAQIEALKSQIDPAESELDAFENAQGDLLNTESEARQTLSRSEHHFAQARIGLARRQEALETWRRRIEDDFGLVAFDYVDEIAGPTPLPLEGMVEQLPRLEQLPPELEDNLRRQRALLRRIGAVNPEAQAEYEEVKQRVNFMTEQLEDLNHAEIDVRQVIAELDELMQRELRRTFDAVADEFGAIFKRLFGGGSARLILTDPDDMGNTGVEIEARLPGRRTQGLALLSGGERSLTATSLVFALLKISPTPFCLLDEVDAMLDEANVGRFRELLRELSEKTQFIIVTHNRNTVQVADVIYGVTMGRDSASQVISLKLDEVEQAVE